MKRLLGLALALSIFMLGGCVYGPGYYQRPAVVYDDGSVTTNGAPVADGDYGYAYDDGYYAPGYYYGGGYGPLCCYGYGYGGWYPWIGVGFYGGYHGWHGGGGHGGWHGGGGHWSGGGGHSGHH